MIKLSKNFSFNELTNTSHKYLIYQNRILATAHMPILVLTAKMLEDIRLLLNCPIHISSGFRFLDLNNRVGGSVKSRHLSGLAVDIYFKNMTTEEAFKILLNSNLTSFRKVIIESVKGKNWIHIETKVNQEDKTQFYTTKNGVNYEEVFR